MIKFSKYHGCGNSFVIVNWDDVAGKDFSDLALKICAEHTGIGADGFIVVKTEPVLEMVFYNRDGSRAPMCGNGIRCFAMYCRDNGIRTENEFPVQTLAGEMIVSVSEESENQTESQIEINMGKPVFEPEACAIDEKTSGKKKCHDTCHGSSACGKKAPLFAAVLDDGQGGDVEVNSLFMGTIHTVIWTDNLDGFDQVGIGGHISNHPVFTEKTNVNMVQMMDRKTMKMRTFERGVGMTLACGTGACASVVAGILRGKCDEEVDVQLPLGTLHIRKTADGDIMMRGPAVKIAEGEIELQ